MNTLVGKTGIQTTDAEIHHKRKLMFMGLLGPENVENLVNLAAGELNQAASRWAEMDRVLLLKEMQEILCRAVCAWAGVPLAESEVKQRTNDLVAMIDGAGGVGPCYLWARLGRARAEKWIGDLVEKARCEHLGIDWESPLHAVTAYRDPDGRLLRKKRLR